MKRGKKGKERLDKYYYLAKEQGYRARSAFKLIQLNKKFDFLSSARAVVDLGAAPGGWCQVCAKTMPVSSLIIGVDLLPIRPIPNVTTLVNDILTQQCRSAIKRELQTWKADVVLHDGAPNVGAQWGQDAYDQNVLVLSALHLATDILRQGGTFVTKVFRSRDYNAILSTLAKLFKTVSVSKPPASRASSAEVFVVCQQYLAPKHVDPALFDPKFVFDLGEQERQFAIDHHTGPTVLSSKPAAHKAIGYDDTDHPLQRRVVSVVDFVEAQNPVHMLSVATEMSFDPRDVPASLAVTKAVAAGEGTSSESAAARTAAATARALETLRVVQEDPNTTGAIVSALSDLRLLGKGDFKLVLRWRDIVRRAVDRHFAADAPAAAAPEARPLTEEEEQERLAREMDEEAHRLARQEHKKQKRLRKRLAKIEEANALNANNPAEDAAAGAGLFSLEKLPRAVTLGEDHDHQDGTTADLFEPPVASSGSEDDEAGDGADDGADDAGAGYDDDGDDVRNIARTLAKGNEEAADDLMLEAELDYMYSQFKAGQRATRVQVRLDGKKKKMKVPQLVDRAAAADAMVVDELPETESLLRGTGLTTGDPLEGIEYDSDADREDNDDDDDDDDDEDENEDENEDEEDEDEENAGSDSEDDGEALRKKGKKSNGEVDATRTLEMIAERRKQRQREQNALLVRPVEDEEAEAREEQLDRAKFEAEGLSRRAEMWYGNSLFEGLNLGGAELSDNDDDEGKSKERLDVVPESESEGESEEDKKEEEKEKEEKEEKEKEDEEARKKQRQKEAKGGFDVPSSGDEWDDSEGISDEDEGKRKRRHKREGMQSTRRKDRAAAKAKAKAKDFDEVPAEEVAAALSSDDEALGRGYGEDSDGENSAANAAHIATQRGRALAARRAAAAAAAAVGTGTVAAAEQAVPPVPELGPKMGREKLATALALARRIATGGKSVRERLIDDSYHRYAFDEDEEDLPDWFVDDEHENMRRRLPVTKEQIEAEKARLQAIDARPVKRVLEVEAKKRLRAARRREAVRNRATAIQAQEDIDPQEKARMIGRLYHRLTAKSARRRRTVLTDSRTGKRIGGARSGRTKLVDKRLKKDARGLARAEKRRISGQRRRHGEVERARHRRQNREKNSNNGSA